MSDNPKIEIDPSWPTLFVTTHDFWPDGALLIFGVKPLQHGQPHPQPEQLAALTEDVDALPLEVGKEGKLTYASLLFRATTTEPDKDQEMTVELARDQDTPDNGTERPKLLDFPLRRSAADPLRVEVPCPLVAKAAATAGGGQP